MAPRLRSAVVRFDALPEPVLRVIMLALPVTTRARCACVCRSWRAFLADVSLWQVLDLSPAGGLARERVTENLARGAVARAAGQLRVLRADHVATQLETALLVELIVSDGAELQELSTDVTMGVEELDAVFAAAPQLQVLNTCVTGGSTTLLPVLRNEPPYGPLRVSKLFVWGPHGAAAELLASAAAVAVHESLTGLILSGALYAQGLNAFADAAAERRVSLLKIGLGCLMDAESVSALARILQRGTLTELAVSSLGFPHAPEASVPVLCAALRACRMLTRLKLHLNPPNHARISARAVTELVDTAASLPALKELDLSNSELQDAAATGRALGAFLASNRPSLHTLRLSFCRLGDEGLASVLDGLAANTHLRLLACQSGNNLSVAFERDRLEPALEALRARAELDE